MISTLDTDALQGVDGDQAPRQKTAMATLVDTSDRSIYTLMDINLEVRRGQLVGIVGAIGSGKSTMLSSLLNELVLHEGSVSLKGTTAYHQQNAWIFNATLKANILFSSPYDEDKFNAVVKAAALEADVSSLANGWATEIGEKVMVNKFF